jgi:long-chain acyl-CoA synthetase
MTAVTAQAGADSYVRGDPAPPPGTLNELFFSALEFDKPNALQFKKGGSYSTISHREIERRVRHIALGLASTGVKPGDRVAILSENRPEWAIADYACLTSGVTDVPIYPTLPADQVAFILNDSGAVAIFVSNAEQAAKIRDVRTSVPSLAHVVSFEEVGPSADMTLAALEHRGAAAETPQSLAEYKRVADSVSPDDLATLIYTSGTTGNPKGVMLTHNNIRSNIDATRVQLPFRGDDVALSFLPLSHIFERMADYLMFATGSSIAYAEGLDTVPVNMMEVRPTIVFSVPRLYEKMYARVLQNALAGGFIKKQIFFWARGVADAWANEKLAGREPRGFLARKYAIAQKLVFSKLKERTGGRLRYFVSGGAPLAMEINKFFYAAGLTILEGYGLTETSPVIGVNTPKEFRIGTIGRPVPGVEVRIAPDGEILTRGPSVMKGYFNNPAATAEAIDSDGWFHTGDIGEIRDGFIAITDRKKDIIVTAGGKNIAPQPVENLVKTNKFVSQAVMIGDKRRFPSMLIVPNFEQLEDWAKKKGIIWTDRAQLVRIPAVHEKMESEVLSACEGLAHYETPRKIALLEQDFSLEKGEMTPTQKVKRRVVDKNYKAVIDTMYAE